MLLFNINGRLVVSQRAIEPYITTLAFSGLSDGLAVNVIATGHATTGVIRFWSSWDLIPLRDIDTGHPESPVFSVQFSKDCKNLYASFNDGYLVIFQCSETSPSKKLKKPSNYIDLSSIIIP